MRINPVTQNDLDHLVRSSHSNTMIFNKANNKANLQIEKRGM